MHEINLGDDESYNVHYRGQTYTMREPSVDEVEKFKSAQGADAQKAVHDMLANLGLPAEVISSMGISKVKKLIDGLVEGMTGKK